MYYLCSRQSFYQKDVKTKQKDAKLKGSHRVSSPVMMRDGSVGARSTERRIIGSGFFRLWVLLGSQGG